jgi:protocatechuate 3,4-dioxygenase beta subunit
MHEQSAWKTRMIGRREALGVMGAAGAAMALGCGGGSPSSPSEDVLAESTGAGTGAACAAETPAETAGPFPSLTDVVRSDVREDRDGTRRTLTIEVANVNDGCSPVSGADVEIWHVDAAGTYSEYGTQAGETFLRGIQTTDANGRVVFTTIYPGWYRGRATHIHVEVGLCGVSRKITQIAFPEEVSNAVHETGAYAGRGTNPIRNASDGIFADSLAAELVDPVGDPASGYAATFPVALSI